MAKQPEQFRAEQKAVYDFVHANYCSQSILGETAATVVLAHATRASHHEFPFGMGLLAILMAATNGTKTDIFPTDFIPLVLAILNNSYPQTRRSAGHRAGLKIGRAIDDHVLQAATARMLQHLRAQYDEVRATSREVSPSPPDDRHPAIRALHVESSTLSSFTEAAFFQRCAGDWSQVTPSERHDLSGRIFYGTSIHLDEAYLFLKMLGLIPASGSGRNQDSGTTTSPDAASEVNKLSQTGTSNMATKTAGSFGQGNVSTTSLGLHGNGHPAIVIPMLRGQFCRCRLFPTTLRFGQTRGATRCVTSSA